MPKPKKAAKAVRKPIQERSRRTVEVILDATARVLTERGYAGTTTNHIAETAGVSIASFYEYFADKDAAIAAVAERLADKGAGIVATYGDLVLKLPPLDALRLAIRQVVAAVAQDGALIRTLYQQVPFAWRLPKVRGFFSRIVDLAKTYTAGQNLVPAEFVTEDRLYFLTVIAGSFIVQVAANPEVEPRREALVGEFIRMLDYYRMGIVMEFGGRKESRPAS